MAVTIKEIAETTGVHVTSVSRILNGKAKRYRIAPNSRKLVLRAAAEMGYRPNAAARSIRNGKFGCAALVLSGDDDERSNLPPLMLHAISHALEEHGMHLTVASLPDEKLTDSGFVPKLLREWMADGLVININKGVPAQLIKLTDEYCIPCVWLNDKRLWDSVYPDDYAAAKRAVTLMLEAGHRRIDYVMYFSRDECSHYSEADRLQGYRDAMTDAGLTPRAHDRHTDPANAEQRLELWRSRLTCEDRPTAVLSYGGTSQYYVVRAAERAGLDIPKDLSLVTFHSEPGFIGMGTTTLLTPIAAVGKNGSEMLLQKIANPDERIPSQAVPFELEPGETLAQVPA